MTFTIIGIIVAAVATLLLGIYSDREYSDGAFAGSIISGAVAVILSVALLILGLSAKENKALIRSHLENPTHYTYSQLAEHNEFVTKAKAWQGTIFSFYNDTDLQTIDIDNISQKAIIQPNDNTSN